MDNVKFTSISDLTLKSTLDGKEEIQVSASEKINLLNTLYKYGKAELIRFSSTHTAFTLKDNTVNWFNSVSAAGITKLIINVSDPLTTGSPIIACIIMRAKLGHKIQIDGYQNIKLSNPDDKDPIIKHNGYGGLTLLGSGLYILEITVVPVSSGPHIIHIACNYTQSDNVIRYKTSNNNRIYFSTQNEEAWNTYYPEVVHSYNEYINIGEIETPGIIETIPSQAFSCHEVSIDNNNNPTTHFLTEIWLPPTVYEVRFGAFVGCKYIRKFHGGVPGLVSENGTQILNTYWNSTVELIAIAPGSCGHSMSLHVQDEAAKETLIFYVDERATSIGDLVFAYMPETIPIRTVVFGHNVKSVAGTSFFMNQCIETLILGDHFLSFHRGSLLPTGYTNIPDRLSRVVCANHQPHILYKVLDPDMSAVEYTLIAPIANQLGPTIANAVPNSIVTQYRGGFMEAAYDSLYPLDNEVVYSTYDNAPVIGAKVNDVGIFNYYNGDPNEVNDYYDPVTSSFIGIGTTVLIGGLFTGNELVQSHWGESEGNVPYFRGIVDNSYGLDMYAGKPVDPRFNFLVTDNIPDTSQYGIVGNIKSLRFPRSVKGISTNTISIGHMEGPLHVYFYSPSVVDVLPNSSGVKLAILPSTGYTNTPVVIHVVKGLLNDYKMSWSYNLNILSGGRLTIVDDINVY